MCDGVACEIVATNALPDGGRMRCWLILVWDDPGALVLLQR